jgi:hypothetical protein
MIDLVRENLVPICWPPQRGQFVFGPNCFQRRGYLSLIMESTHLEITYSAPNCRTCARQYEGGCFLCCKQNTGLRTSFFRRDYYYTSHVPRYAVALPCSTAGCKQCDLVTRWAPPHYHRDVTRRLNLTLPGRWMGRGGYITWPPRWPVLTP